MIIYSSSRLRGGVPGNPPETAQSLSTDNAKTSLFTMFGACIVNYCLLAGLIKLVVFYTNMLLCIGRTH